MLNAPCKDCDMRILGCHSTCELYLDWQKERNEIKKRSDELWGFENDYIGFRRDGFENRRKRYGKHKK